MEQTDSLVVYSDREFEDSPSEYVFTDVLAGDTKSRTVWLRNETNDMIEQIEFATEDPDVQLVGLPERLNGHSSRSCKIVFKPSEDRIVSLNAMFTIKAMHREPIQPKRQERGI